MDASHLVDAATTSFIASVGICAAVVRRHWFLRFAAVGGVLALGLLVPAYEIVIEFAIQVAVISAGVMQWRGTTIRRPRMSLETALLAMVVAAVLAAVVGAAPTFGWDTWVRIVFLGLALGAMSLLSRGIACGRASLPVRLFGGAIGILVFIAIFHFGIALRDAFYAAQRGNDWWSYLVSCYRPDFLAPWLTQVAPSIILGVVTFTSLLMLARGSGWFTEREETNDDAPLAPLIKALSRAGLCAGFGIIAAANLYLLYRLCTPPGRLPVNIPADNGYDDFLAAGRLPKIDYSILRSQNFNALSDRDLARLRTELQPALALLDAGLAKPSWATSAYASGAQASSDQTALINGAAALVVEYEALRRSDRWQELVDRICDALQLAYESSRGQRSEYSVETYLGWGYPDRMGAMLGALTPSECRALAGRLVELDQRCEPVELKLERNRIYRLRLSWQDHMRSLINEWNGVDDNANGRMLSNSRSQAAALRLLVAQAALQAYWGEHGTLPTDLARLVPEYLPALPGDPMGDGPLKYDCQGGVYRVYSVGHDGQDDGGVEYVDGRWADVVKFGPHLTPVPYRWKRRAAAFATRALQAIKSGSDAAAAEQELRPPGDAR